MHSKSDSIEILVKNKADEVTEEIVYFFLSTLLFRYQINLLTTMRCGNFVFDCVDLLR